MADTFVLWTHALAALLFGAMAIASWRGTERGWPRTPFCAAALLTALWALGVAGNDPADLGTRLVGAARNLAWLWFAAALAHREGARGRAATALYLVVGAVVVASAALTPALAAPLPPRELAAIAAVRQAFRVLAALGALVLLCRLAQSARRDGRWMALAVGGIWATELAIAGAALLLHGVGPALVAARGAVFVGVGAMIAVAAQAGEQGPTVSRSAALRLLGTLAVVGYLALAAWSADAVGGWMPDYARALRAAVVLGATVALFTLASTPWLRAWSRVKLAKHFSPHRYDYRVEWQRFTATLGLPGDGEPLGPRLVRAMAELVDAPSGLLLRHEHGGLAPIADWHWTGDTAPCADEAFAATLAGGHIVALDEERRGEGARVPTWLLDERAAWIVVPLIHGDALAGAIALSRPPIDRSLDWEDLDLLRVAGRQAASHLEEDRAHLALAEAARFDEFNRRFAFVLHDIKNVASQLALVARNAERHADNAEFRADMVETLRDGAGRLGTLLTRLGGHDASRPEPIQPTDVAALARRVVARWPGCVVDGDGRSAALALAAPGRLEQALAHLVQNAAEASDGEPVRLVVAAGDRIAIEVVDRGPGMSARFVRDDLFRPFASTKAGGFGVGAYEARQLIVGMGGTLAVTSREGEGSRFRIELPAAPALEAAA